MRHANVQAGRLAALLRLPYQHRLYARRSAGPVRQIADRAPVQLAPQRCHTARDAGSQHSPQSTASSWHPGVVTRHGMRGVSTVHSPQRPAGTPALSHGTGRGESAQSTASSWHPGAVTRHGTRGVSTVHSVQLAPRRCHTARDAGSQHSPQRPAGTLALSHGTGCGESAQSTASSWHPGAVTRHGTRGVSTVHSVQLAP